MFLRWTQYRDKAGRTRLYARLVRCWRDGKRVRHESIGSLYVRIQDGVEWPDETRRDFWHRLDYVLQCHRPSQAERANIERVFAAKLGPRPPLSGAAKLIAAVHKFIDS
jgi:hypothetical protein